jgi:hypothetical protein
MRSIAFLAVIGFMITACDDSRVYEKTMISVNGIG